MRGEKRERKRTKERKKTRKKARCGGGKGHPLHCHNLTVQIFLIVISI